MKNETKQLIKKYPNVWIVENMRIEKHKYSGWIVSKYQWLYFVKKHKNVFNDKTIYRTYDYGRFLIVKEFNYFQGEKSIWLWIYDVKDGFYYVLSNINNKKDIPFYLNIIRNNLN